jgi:hypothetical protein
VYPSNLAKKEAGVDNYFYLGARWGRRTSREKCFKIVKELFVLIANVSISKDIK